MKRQEAKGKAFPAQAGEPGASLQARELALPLVRDKFCFLEYRSRFLSCKYYTMKTKNKRHEVFFQQHIRFMHSALLAWSGSGTNLFGTNHWL